MSKEPKTDQEKIAKLSELLKDIHIAMLTTVANDGSLHSRPMAYQAPDAGFDGTLYFFTRADSPKADEVQREEKVNVAFTEPKKQEYVSLSGTAQISFDKAKIKELWNPFYKAWFPDGLDDPQLALLVVSAEHAEYWDVPNGAVVTLFGLVKATLTGKTPTIGENETVELPAAGRS